MRAELSGGMGAEWWRCTFFIVCATGNREGRAAINVFQFLMRYFLFAANHYVSFCSPCRTAFFFLILDYDEYTPLVTLAVLNEMLL
jgi:hypothetical protein